jgi:hypothetical protein
MDRSEFWRLIESVNYASTDNCIDYVTRLSHHLAGLPADEIVAFNRILDELYGITYHWDLWAAAYIINGGCSDDCFIYFRGWLIAQGESVFNNALENPDSLADVVEADAEGDVECEHMLNVAEWAYEAKSGEEIPFYGRKFWFDEQPSGSEFDFDDDETMTSRFPKLAAKFIDEI